MSKHEEPMVLTVQPNFIEATRSTAMFLRANYNDLSRQEADVIAARLEEAASALSRIEAETEARVLEMAAKVCERRAENRFNEYGTREPDTGATYYGGRMGEELTARDEEDEDCAKAIRALSKNLPTSPKSVVDTDVSTEGGLIDGGQNEIRVEDIRDADMAQAMIEGGPR